MEQTKRIIFTVTNDLSYDQRMIRICTSVVEAGYEVLLIAVNAVPRSHWHNKFSAKAPEVLVRYRQVVLP